MHMLCLVSLQASGEANRLGSGGRNGREEKKEEDKTIDLGYQLGRKS